MFGSRLRKLALASLFAVLSMGLVGASCNGAKKPVTGEGKPDARPAVEEALGGVDVADLKPEERQQFFRLLDSVPSPCGKPHSLRVSLKTDPDCKRAPFAARYVKRLSVYGAEDEELLGLIKNRYQQEQLRSFELAGAPFEGQPDAKIVIVEFFDYACPHCKLALPMLEDVAAEYPGDVIIYFFHFPLGSGGQSVSLASAAVAAQKQGKFREMHRKLFAAQEDDQSDDTVKKIAAALGLDMTRFEADWKNPETEAFVRAQKAQGIKAEIDGTPAIYINGKTFTDPHEFEWIKSWIDEDLASR